MGVVKANMECLHTMLGETPWKNRMPQVWQDIAAILLQEQEAIWIE